MYFGDVRELSIYLKNKKLQEISSHDLQQWIGSLVSPTGKGIERKTVNRKVSAIITYFLWLQGVGAITRDPTLSLKGVIAPFPGYELLKFPFLEFAFSPQRNFVFAKQWL